MGCDGVTLSHRMQQTLSRSLAQRADLECARWLADAQVPFSLVFTKADKRKKKCPSPSDNMQAFQVRALWIAAGVLQQCPHASNPGHHAAQQAELLREFENLPPVFETDAETLRGQPELLAYIAQLRVAHEQG